MKTQTHTIYNHHLTGEQKKQIDNAVEKVTLEMIQNLYHGEDVVVSDNVVLSNYSDIITLNIEDEWIEVFQVMHAGTEIIYESL